MFQEYPTTKPLFKKNPQIPPWALPSGWSIVYLCDIFECDCATFMFLYVLQEYRRPKPLFRKFTQITPMRSALWFKQRPFLRYYRIKFYYIYVLEEYIRAESLLRKFIRFYPWEFPADPDISCFWGIIERNWATFMCFKNIQDPNRYLKNFHRSHDERYPLIKVSFVFAIYLNAIVQHSCAFYVLQEYHRPKPLF